MANKIKEIISQSKSGINTQKQDDNKRMELLNKYASKKTSTTKTKHNITKIIIPKRIPKINIEQNIDSFVSIEEFNKIIKQIKDKNFLLVAKMIYNGVPKDDRIYQEKLQDPFVIFLKEEINQIENIKEYFTIKQKDINNILAIKLIKVEKEKVKMTIFKILLQRIKSEILGNDPDRKDITKKEVEANINNNII